MSESKEQIFNFLARCINSEFSDGDIYKISKDKECMLFTGFKF
jgi:hypothetical protein